jgi:hypothetical protein
LSFPVAIRKLHREHSLHRATVLGALAALLTVLVPAISKAQPAPTVEITPNAIQTLDEPMRIKVKGSPHATLHVLILRSCDSNPATPELRSRGNCKTPVWRRDVPLDHRGQWRYRLHFTELTEQPVDEQLWLRVSTDPDGRGSYGQTIFTIRGSGSCSLGKTFLSLSTNNMCSVGWPLSIVHPLGGPAVGQLGQVPLAKRYQAPPSILLATTLYYELDERISLGILPDVGVCIGGDRCATTYNFAVESLYSLVDEDLIAIAARVGWNPSGSGLYAGLPVRLPSGNLALLYEPRLSVARFDRAVKTAVLTLPVQLQYQLTHKNALLLTTGIVGPLSDFGDDFAVLVGMGTAVALSQHVDIGGEVLLTNLAGRNRGADARMLLLRLAVRWGDRR